MWRQNRKWGANMPLFLCFDIGGTTIKYGVADGSGRFVEKLTAQNPIKSGGAGRMLSYIIGRTKDLQTKYDICGIAVSTAGVVDVKTGSIIHGGDNFPGYAGTRLKEILSEKSGLPCTVENDVNCAALGEWWLGAAKGKNSAFCITVGTGIGGCLLIDGKVWHGVSQSAGELGYMQINGETLEMLASTSRLVKEAADVLELSVDEIDGETIFAMAKLGNKKIQELIERQMNYLATGIANVCYLINPEIIVLGGGIMEERDYLRPLLQHSLEEKLIPLLREKTIMEFAHLGNVAGMAGALYNFKQCMTKQEEHDGSQNT